MAVLSGQEELGGEPHTVEKRASQNLENEEMCARNTREHKGTPIFTPENDDIFLQKVNIF